MDPLIFSSIILNSMILFAFLVAEFVVAPFFGSTFEGVLSKALFGFIWLIYKVSTCFCCQYIADVSISFPIGSIGIE
jgi:hypothetical protein